MKTLEITAKQAASFARHYCIAGTILVSLCATFLISLTLLVYPNFHLFQSLGGEQLVEFDRAITQLAKLDKNLTDDVIRIEFDLELSGVNTLSQYLSELQSIKHALQHFDNFGVPAPLKQDIKRHASIIDKKIAALKQYQEATADYERSKKGFYANRVKINQQINDESISNPYQIQVILDSIQRQVSLFLQYSDPNRKSNSVDFLRRSGTSLKKIAPELETAFKSYINRGILLIEHSQLRREHFKKILFDTKLTLNVAALNLSLARYKTGLNTLMLLGLSLICFFSGFLFYQSIKRKVWEFYKLNSNASHRKQVRTPITKKLQPRARKPQRKRQ